MITTFQALLVTLLALLPGASYTFAFERVAGAYGITLSDRLIRFLAASAVLGALASGPAFILYRRWIATGRLGRGEVEALWLELFAVAYVAVPIVLGSAIGAGVKQRWRWLRLLTGESRQPRAWDFLWRSDLQAVLRLRLKSGIWLAGVFGTDESGRRSYAAGYPEPSDLFLSTQLQIDGDEGFLQLDAHGAPVPVDGRSGLLLRWGEIEYLELEEF